ncbi:hypothetical protein Nepgr_033110 [Nepenthes gracilis]|uniref:Uncharacterized protein n=1 Tax=Nepenthes gracilis TaxID=150966 RepID=A0AAD3TKT1_NEPGR|nr:hypothetical protein Nepgr_033110 [Nepenthes gracilis]
MANPAILKHYYISNGKARNPSTQNLIQCFFNISLATSISLITVSKSRGLLQQNPSTQQLLPDNKYGPKEAASVWI